jgi:uncharacterized protein (TIGR02217 family)
MAITVYSDIVLANRVLQAGLRGKQQRRNQRVTTSSGQMAANVLWTQTLLQFDMSFIPLSHDDWQYVQQLHEVTEGGAFGFLMEDPKDSDVITGQGVVQSLTSTTFQLYKRYLHAASGRYKDRKITRPRESTLAVLVSGSPATYTVDDETGIVTIAAAPSAANVTWTGQFYVPVHFMDDSIDWEIVGSGQTAQARYVAGTNILLQEVRE